MGPTVIAVDGHPTMRLGIVVLLGEANVPVIGESGDGEQALRMAETERPDLVLLGLNLVGSIDGIETCRRLKALGDAPRVLIHTAYDFAEDVSSCFLAGADSYLHKRAEPRALLDTVQRTSEGERVWALGRSVGELRCRIDADPVGSPLTGREKEVLALALRRYTNAEIAVALGISVRTVKNHMGQILSKLGARRRADLLKGSPASADILAP